MKRFVGPLLGFVAGALLGAVVAGQLLAAQLRSTLSEYVGLLQSLERHRAERDLALLVSLRERETRSAIEALERRIDGSIERLEARPGSEEDAKTLAALRAHRDGAPPPAAPAGAAGSGGVTRLLSTARVLPAFEAGEMVGLRVSEISPDGPWARLGVREGDVVVRVGEVSLDSPATVVALLEALDGGPELGLERLGESRIALVPR